MSDVAEFKLKRPTHVFECACGCQLFYLVSDGRVECRVCGSILRDVRHNKISSESVGTSNVSGDK